MKDNWYMSYSRIGITKPSIGLVHPFKIDIGKDGKKSDGTPQYTLAVNYHSRLYKELTTRDRYLDYTNLTITGLDFVQRVPSSFPGKNYYCVLNIDVSDLSATSAKIEWVEGDNSQDDLAPVVFTSSDNLRQTKARIIIGVLVSDDEAVAGLPGNESAVNTSYIMQFVNTNLLMCNMVFNGVPIIYPVPFGGGRLNF